MIHKGKKDAALVVTIPGAGKIQTVIAVLAVLRERWQISVTAQSSAAEEFIFDTEDGIIANWTGASNTATVARDNSASGAVYKGLALINSNIRFWQRTSTAAKSMSSDHPNLNTNFVERLVHRSDTSRGFRSPRHPRHR